MTRRCVRRLGLLFVTGSVLTYTHVHTNPQADARAHNIDLAAKKEADLKKEWDEFQKFATEVQK